MDGRGDDIENGPGSDPEAEDALLALAAFDRPLPREGARESARAAFLAPLAPLSPRRTAGRRLRLLALFVLPPAALLGALMIAAHDPVQDWTIVSVRAVDPGATPTSLPAPGPVIHGHRRARLRQSSAPPVAAWT